MSAHADERGLTQLSAPAQSYDRILKAVHWSTSSLVAAIYIAIWVSHDAATKEQQAVPHKKGMSEVEYRFHWARTHLKAIGALENSARGIWTVTDHGRSMSEPEMRTANREWKKSLREQRLAQLGSQVAEAEGRNSA